MARGSRRSAARSAQRVGDVREERLGEPARGRDPERVAIQPGVGGDDPAVLAGQPDLDRAPLAGERLEHRGCVDTVEHARRDLGFGQVAERAQQVVHSVPGRDAPVVRQPLEVELDRSPAPPGRSARAAPPARAARAAGRGRATAPPPGARRSAYRPRTCRSRRSRTAARRQTARPSVSRLRPARSRGGGAWSAARPAPARPIRRGGTRGRSRG